MPETLLQSPAPPPVPNVEAEAILTASAHITHITSKPENFEQMLTRIKEFHSKLDMDELKGKSIEMFVCNICYEVYARSELLRDHYMTVSENLSIRNRLW